MQHNKFYYVGKFIYRFRWPIIVLWSLFIIFCLFFIPNIVAPFKTTGFVVEKSSSDLAAKHLDNSLGYNNTNQFIVIYHSPTLLATHSQFINKMKKSLEDLKNYPIKHDIIYPSKDKQISKDKHSAYAVVILKTNKPISEELVDQFKKSVKTPSNMTIDIGSEPIFVDSVNKQTQTDLYNADFITTPVALITLILVFGTVVSAIIPIVLGGGCASNYTNYLVFFRSFIYSFNFYLKHRFIIRALSYLRLLFIFYQSFS